MIEHCWPYSRDKMDVMLKWPTCKEANMIQIFQFQSALLCMCIQDVVMWFSSGLSVFSWGWHTVLLWLCLRFRSGKQKQTAQVLIIPWDMWAGWKCQKNFKCRLDCTGCCCCVGWGIPHFDIMWVSPLGPPHAGGLPCMFLKFTSIHQLYLFKRRQTKRKTHSYVRFASAKTTKQVENNCSS